MIVGSAIDMWRTLMNNPYDGTQLCAQTDSEVFFPSNNFRRKQEVALAISICNKCHLIEACRKYADSHVGTYGVWGGRVYDGTGYESPVTVVSKRKVA